MVAITSPTCFNLLTIGFLSSLTPKRRNYTQLAVRLTFFGRRNTFCTTQPLAVPNDTEIWTTCRKRNTLPAKKKPCFRYLTITAAQYRPSLSGDSHHPKAPPPNGSTRFVSSLHSSKEVDTLQPQRLNHTSTAIGCQGVISANHLSL